MSTLLFLKGRAHCQPQGMLRLSIPGARKLSQCNKKFLSFFSEPSNFWGHLHLTADSKTEPEF
jgi:hypothetical protein